MPVPVLQFHIWELPSALSLVADALPVAECV
jgi:hypothetical protein